LGDYDNDGDLDLFLTTIYGHDASRLYRNNGNWNFTNVTFAQGLGTIPDDNYQAAWADYDNDGDLDLLTGAKVFKNQSQDNGNHWLKLRLQGDGKRISTTAAGAQVRITLGNQTLTRQVELGTGEGNQNDPTLHFGLGGYNGDLNVEVLWPDGTLETYGAYTDQTIVLTPGSRSSAKAILMGETWVESHNPTSNFEAGIQGDGSIAGNESGGQLRWIQEGSTVIARGTLIQFSLPKLQPDEIVTGIRLTGFSTEAANADQVIQVGWATQAIDLTAVTFNDVAIGTDSAAFEIDWDSAQFVFSEELGNIETAAPLSPFVYEDLTASDGLTAMLAGIMNNNTNPVVTVVLSPTGDPDYIAIIHGSDPSDPQGDSMLDPLNNPTDPQYHPQLEILLAMHTLFGDANNDDVVTGADLIAVQQNFAATLTPSGAPVPEPGVLSLFGLTGLGLYLRQRTAG